MSDFLFVPADGCPEDCSMCSGETCAKCGAGCWNNAIGILEPPCEHDAIERHEEPGVVT